MTFAYPETFTLVSRAVTGTDAYGNDVYGATSTTVKGAFAPAGSSEITQGQATVLTHDTIYLEAGSTTPSPTDRIQRAGVTYDIDGTPRVYRNPFTGQAPGPVLALLAVTG